MNKKSQKKPTKKQNARTFDAVKSKMRRFGVWLKTPKGLVIALVSLPIIIYGGFVLSDYVSDLSKYSDITHRNEELSKVAEKLDDASDDLSIVASKDYCNYDQGKFGDEGGPYCGRYVVLAFDQPSQLNYQERGELSDSLVSTLSDLNIMSRHLNTEYKGAGRLVLDEINCPISIISKSNDYETDFVYGIELHCTTDLKRWQFFERGSPRDVKLY